MGAINSQTSAKAVSVRSVAAGKITNRRPSRRTSTTPIPMISQLLEKSQAVGQPER